MDDTPEPADEPLLILDKMILIAAEEFVADFGDGAIRAVAALSFQMDDEGDLLAFLVGYQILLAIQILNMTECPPGVTLH